MSKELFLSGECGESIVTIGGDFWEGVTIIMLCGRALGGVGRLFCPVDAGGSRNLSPSGVRVSPKDVLPSELRGRTVGALSSAFKDT